MTRAGKSGWILAGILSLVAIAVNAPALHLLGWQERNEYLPASAPGATAAVFLSGDMGLHLGMSSDIARGLAANGYKVTAVSSPVAFSRRLTRMQTDQVVIDAIKDALGVSERKVVLVGQSFGADILATVVPDLPAPLRQRIAGVVLVVPSNNVHFRADPSGIAYLGVPDDRPAHALRKLLGTPIACIHGANEATSLCPLLQGTVSRNVALPGDHYLQHNAPRVLHTVLGALAAMRR